MAVPVAAIALQALAASLVAAAWNADEDDGRDQLPSRVSHRSQIERARRAIARARVAVAAAQRELERSKRLREDLARKKRYE